MVPSEGMCQRGLEAALSLSPFTLCADSALSLSFHTLCGLCVLWLSWASSALAASPADANVLTAASPADANVDPASIRTSAHFRTDFAYPGLLQACSMCQRHYSVPLQIGDVEYSASPADANRS